MALPFPAAAVIVAGGHGSRMESAVPKQFLPIGGIPILVHTFRRFFHTGLFSSIVIVLPEDQLDSWREIQQRYLKPEETFLLAPGGKTRSESVLNGLKALPATTPECIVGIHDGVRPFINPEFLRNCLNTAWEHGNAIPCITPPESFRYMDSAQADETLSHAIDRQRIRSIQTPQCFRLSTLQADFQRQDCLSFTDEASLAEASGNPIRLCEGLLQNIKITRPFDLQLAEFLLQKGY